MISNYYRGSDSKPVMNTEIQISGNIWTFWRNIGYIKFSSRYIRNKKSPFLKGKACTNTSKKTEEEGLLPHPFFKDIFLIPKSKTF